jgi:hypothetical protein
LYDWCRRETSGFAVRAPRVSLQSPGFFLGERFEPNLINDPPSIDLADGGEDAIVAVLFDEPRDGRSRESGLPGEVTPRGMREVIVVRTIADRLKKNELVRRKFTEPDV